jgi:hypothetical protein
LQRRDIKAALATADAAAEKARALVATGPRRHATCVDLIRKLPDRDVFIIQGNRVSSLDNAG